MKRAKRWVVFSLALLFVLGTVTLGFAAAKKAAPAKKAPAAAEKVPGVAEGTRDMRTLFGHNVDGLEPVTLIYASDAPLNTNGDAWAVNFKNLVEAESKGKIKIDLHRFGALYKMLDMPKVVPIGTVHFGNINKGLLMSRENGYAPWIIGYIWKNPEHLLSVACSPEWYEMEDRLARGKWNMKPLVNTTIGNWDYFSRKPFTSMKDFGGKKVWSYGELASAYIASWGGTPVMKSTSEMYMAFYNDSLNMISFSTFGFLQYKFYEGGKYWVNMPVYPPGSVGIHYNQNYMNLDKWNSLPLAYKKIILDAQDLSTWAGTFEGICSERLGVYELINRYKVVDCGISTKYPKEYEKIKAAAVAAGRKYVVGRGATQQQLDEANAILEKYSRPEHTSRYSWWYKLAWAEAERRVKDVENRLKEGKSWDEATDPYHPKHRYNWTAEQVKKEWMDTPRVKWDWNEATRLK
jgi:TRAP-type C4-dicarboxylate transport system substrate-binding protein